MFVYQRVRGTRAPGDPAPLMHHYLGMFYRSTAKKTTQVEAKVLASTGLGSPVRGADGITPQQM